MKYNVKVTFEFYDVDAESEEEAEAYVEGRFTHYVYHPQKSELISPSYDFEAVEQSVQRTATKPRKYYLTHHDDEIAKSGAV